MHSPDAKKVFVGIPFSDGSTRWETSMSLISLLASRINREFVLFPGGGCDIAHARNLLVHECLNHSGKDCARMVMIDSDIGFSAQQIERLLSHNFPYVGGIYPRKNPRKLAWSVNGKKVVRDDGLWAVDELCTGFVSIDTQFLRRMIAKYPETAYEIEDEAYRGQIGHELFAMGVVERRRLSEDYYFSRRCREMGETPIADPQIQLGHVGTVDFLRLHAVPGLGS